MILSLIAAVARNGAIGRNNSLLLHLSEDLKHFKRVTLGCPLIMGRKTWDSIGRALPGRRNIVVTRNVSWHAPGAETAPSLDAALALTQDAAKVFVIGGAELFAQALPRADELVLTEIDAELTGDTFFPPWDRTGFSQASRENHVTPDGLKYSFAVYTTTRGN